MHDTVALEKLGTPTALIVTNEFVHEARMQRAALGLPALGIAVIAHPLSTLSEAEIKERARQAAPQVKAIWLKGVAAEQSVA